MSSKLLKTCYFFALHIFLNCLITYFYFIKDFSRNADDPTASPNSGPGLIPDVKL